MQNIQQKLKEGLVQLNQDINERISDVKKCSIVDTGLPEQLLFEEMEQFSRKYYVDEHGVQHERPKPSLWVKILDSIQKYPKFQKMKDFIEAASEERHTKEQQEKRKLLQQYII